VNYIATTPFGQEEYRKRMIDNPVNPQHYQKHGGIETIDYLEAVCAYLPGDEAVSVANVLKYISRYREKHPDDVTRDLRKAAWYLDRLIALVEAKEAVRSAEI
jgi:uncharacterized protein DUF3310